MYTFLSFLHPAALWFTIGLNLYQIVFNLCSIATLYLISSRAEELSIGIPSIVKQDYERFSLKYGIFPITGWVKMYKYSLHGETSGEVDTLDSSTYFYAKSKFSRAFSFLLVPMILFIALTSVLLLSPKLADYFTYFLETLLFQLPIEEFLRITTSLYDEYFFPLIMCWQFICFGVLAFPFSCIQAIEEYRRKDFIEGENKSSKGVIFFALYAYAVSILTIILLLRVIFFNGGWPNIGYVLITFAITQGAILLIVKMLAILVSPKPKAEVLQG